jgi:hypothetical protein
LRNVPGCNCGGQLIDVGLRERHGVVIDDHTGVHLLVLPGCRFEHTVQRNLEQNGVRPYRILNGHFTLIETDSVYPQV